MNLLGQSYGGMVAQAYALKYPQSVKRLILVDTFYSGQMWQANDDNANHEIQTQFPEAWTELQEAAARRGLHSSAAPGNIRSYTESIPLGVFYFYDASNASLLPARAQQLRCLLRDRRSGRGFSHRRRHRQTRLPRRPEQARHAHPGDRWALRPHFPAAIRREVQNLRAARRFRNDGKRAATSSAPRGAGEESTTPVLRDFLGQPNPDSPAR